ncbi:MAG: hypothetical protein QXJ06_00465 [Candidatus Aenigmatarchaeota archaeon]
MAMELEYPFKIALYMFVVAVVIGILLVFKTKFVNMCFIPPCDKEKNMECLNEPVKIVEDILDENVLDKYYMLCLQKSKDCQKDIFCYIISLNEYSNPSLMQPNCLQENCEITCDKDVNMIYIFYKWSKGKIEIGC